MTRLDAKGLTIRIGDQQLLDGVDFQIRSGEFVGLIGPNGAGKSTLLRALLGLITIDSGEVLLDDVPFDRIARKSVARRLAYLPQYPDSHWAISVAHLVSLGRIPFQSPWRRQTPGDRAAIQASMAAMDIEHLRRRRVTTLSGGERIRVQLARALAGDPEILLTDEPVASLDPYHQLHVMELLRHRAHHGFGVLVVLHDLTLATRFCDRIVLLKSGRKLADGEPVSVLTESNLLSAYRVQAIVDHHAGETIVVPWARVE